MCVIILTSTVFVKRNIDCIHQINPTERINTYVYSVKKWLYNTNFKILLVENSGYLFPELENEKVLFNNRFEIISFNEKDSIESNYYNTHQLSSKGLSELFSINYAFFHSKLIKPTDFIIKITARFFIDELENYLSQYDLNEYDCLTQNNRDRCEMVGCHFNYFYDIFNIHIFHSQVEIVYKERTSQLKKILTCKVFNIEETQRGGLPEKFNTI
jgi:hypothetical protein